MSGSQLLKQDTQLDSVTDIQAAMGDREIWTRNFVKQRITGRMGQSQHGAGRGRCDDDDD